MNNFDVEIKCNDQIFKAVAKIIGDTLTVSSVNPRSQSAGNTAGQHRL
jgi:hypothetical protein